MRNTDRAMEVRILEPGAATSRLPGASTEPEPERSSTTTSSHPLRRVAFGRVDASRAASATPVPGPGTGQVDAPGTAGPQG